MPRVTDLRHRGGTAAQWTSTNPVLGAREIGVETDTNKFKIGDGVTAWTSLQYRVTADLDVSNLWKSPYFMPATGGGRGLGQIYTGAELVPAGNAVVLAARDHIAVDRYPVMPGEKYVIEFTFKLLTGTLIPAVGFWLYTADGVPGSPARSGWEAWLGSSGPVTKIADLPNGFARYRRVHTIPSHDSGTSPYIPPRAGALYFQLGQFSPYSSSSIISDVSARRVSLEAEVDALPTSKITGLDTALSGKANSSHTHGGADITGTGKSATTFLRGDNTWVVPTNTTYSTASQAEIENSASTTARLISGQRMAQGVLKHAPVQSVAGMTGAVTLAKADVGLASVDNTADADKPISSATQTALDGKSAVGHTHLVSAVQGLQTELDAKFNTADASVSATASTIVKRDTDGTVAIALPTLANHAASKGYVDDGRITATPGAKFRQVGCVIRNTGTGFEFINDAGHVPSGVTSVQTYTDRIVINYSFTATKVISAHTTPDETLARRGYAMGPSVGLSAMTIYVGQPGMADYVTTNGTTLTSLNGYVKSFSRSTTAWTFNHDTIDGPVGGSVQYRYISGTFYQAHADSLSTTATVAKLYNSSGTLVNPSTASGTFAFWIMRGGTRRVDPLNELDIQNSNIWVSGLFEV